jgi:ABC-type multidrug transport system fused ATPase/permease subunit
LTTHIYSLIFKIFYIYKKSKKNTFYFLVLLTIVRTIFEILSLGLIIPILSFLSDFEKYKLLLYYYIPYFEILQKNEIVVLSLLSFIVVYLIKTLFVSFYNYYRTIYCNQLFVSLSEKILNIHLKNKYIFFIENNSSSLIRNINVETNLFSFGVIGNLIDIISQFIIIISFCTFLIIFNTYSLFVIFFIATFGALIVWFNYNNFKKWGEIRQFHTSKLIQKLNEIFGNIKEIIIHQKKDFFIKQTKFHIEKTADSTAKRDIYLGLSAPTIEFLSILVFFTLSIFLIKFTNTKFEEILILLGVFGFAALKLLPNSINLVKSIQMLRFNAPCTELLFSELKKDEKNSNSSKKKNNKIKKISFSNISFSYPKNKNKIFNNINFEIKSFDKVAIVGKTGIGKSSLINLLSGLLEPTSGEILINDKKNSISIFYSQIAYVSQNVYLADDSIYSNITFSDNQNDKKRVEKILEILDLSDLINSLEKGLNTVIGEKGSKISGGQVQRIGIARALFKNPSILFLDEATSSLDEQTEIKILNNIFKIMKNKIVIFSTHRKSVTKYCNRIIEINKNNVIIKSN